MKLTDFKGLFKKATLKVVSIENPEEDYYIVKMSYPKGTTWEPGEHGIFKLPGKEITGKKWRAFSVSSVKEEGYVMIGTRTGDKISSFKQELINMKAGEEVSVIGPFGWFKLQDKSSPIVLTAQGVGITPIRAILKSLEHDQSREVVVIHASKSTHLYGDDLVTIAENNPKINYHKTASKNETQELMASLVKKYQNSAYYYNSGSKAALKENAAYLKEIGVSGKRIIEDPFMGY